MLTSLNALPVTTRVFDPGWVFLNGPNPFGLSDPPRWFLEELWRFDPLLTIFRSQEEPLYRLCRRVEHGKPILAALMGHKRNGEARPDSTMLVAHRIVPITSILPSPMVAWSPVLLGDLARRDIRRAGGARKAADILDGYDDREAEDWRKTTEDGAENLARFSYRMIKGDTVDLGGRGLHGARTGVKPKRFHPASRPRLSPESFGAMFTGREEPLQESRPFVADETVARPRTGVIFGNA